MVEKNICQNPKCFESHTKDRWNKNLGVYQSRKAYHKPRPQSEFYRWIILEYFCTTSCANSWLNVNMESIARRTLPPFIEHRRISEGYEKRIENHYGRNFNTIRKIGVDNNAE